MTRLRIISLLTLFVSLRAATLSGQQTIPIQHVVFIVKENRTFDHYFGAFPGVDGASAGTISTGQSIPLQRAPDQTIYDIDHTWSGAITAMNNGAMNQFDLISGGNTNGDYLS